MYDGQVASRDWNVRVTFLSLNECEMLTILMALKAFSSLIRGNEHSSSYRQHFCDGKREPQGWPEPSSFKVCKGHLVRGDRDWCLDKVCAYSRSREPGVRFLVQEGRQTQLEASSQTFCLPGRFMGSTHSRQIRELSKYTASATQQQVLVTIVQSLRRIVSGQLALPKQFYQRYVLSRRSVAGKTQKCFLSIMYMPEPQKVSVTMSCNIIHRSNLRIFFFSKCISRSILDFRFLKI